MHANYLRCSEENKHLFHHPVVNITKALFADRTRFQAF